MPATLVLAKFQEAIFLSHCYSSLPKCANKVSVLLTIYGTSIKIKRVERGRGSFQVAANLAINF